MKVGIYYDNRFGRNDGPPLYYFHVLLEQLKFETYHLIPTGDTRKDVGNLDYHFWVDWGEDALGYPDWEIPNDGGIKVYVVSDAHLDNGYRFKKAHQFHHVFFNQHKFLKQFSEYNRSHDIKNSKVKSWHFLPHAVEPIAYPYVETIKKYDICFIGHMQKDEPNYNGMSRVQALDRLFKAFPNFYFGSRHPAFPEKNLFEDAARRFSESKIIFNISIKDDINMRVFEALSTKSLLVTNYLPTLSKLFVDGKHLVTYKNHKEMIDKVQWYIEHDEEREKIAEAGYNEVINKHTYKHRVLEIIEKTKNK